MDEEGVRHLLDPDGVFGEIKFLPTAVCLQVVVYDIARGHSGGAFLLRYRRAYMTFTSLP